MRLAFLDDSQQAEPPRQGLGRLLALGAVIVPQEHVAGYAADLVSIRARYGIPSGEEIKWKAPKGSFLASAGADLITSLRSSMLEAAIERRIRTVVVMVDHAAAYTSYTEAEVAARSSGRRAQGRQPVASRDSTADQRRHRIRHARADRAADRHRALARLAASPARRPRGRRDHCGGCGQAIRPQPRPPAGQADAAAQLGDANGAGIVLWSRRYNLLYHAFGETSVSLPSQNTGVTLPCPEWSYADNDGLAVGARPA